MFNAYFSTNGLCLLLSKHLYSYGHHARTCWTLLAYWDLLFVIINPNAINKLLTLCQLKYTLIFFSHLVMLIIIAFEFTSCSEIICHFSVIKNKLVKCSLRWLKTNQFSIQTNMQSVNQSFSQIQGFDLSMQLSNQTTNTLIIINHLLPAIWLQSKALNMI